MIEIASEPQTLLLFILLVLAFVVAFKLMEMVFETIMVSILSGIFYLGMVYLFGYSLTLDRVILFAFLGSAFYMAYSLMSSAYTLLSMVIGIPYALLKLLFSPFSSASKNPGKNVGKKLKKYSQKMENYSRKMKELEQKVDKKGSDEDERDVKEVVLGKVNEDKSKD